MLSKHRVGASVKLHISHTHTHARAHTHTRTHTHTHIVCVYIIRLLQITAREYAEQRQNLARHHFCPQGVCLCCVFVCGQRVRHPPCSLSANKRIQARCAAKLIQLCLKNKKKWKKGCRRSKPGAAGCHVYGSVKET